ncbi:MAG: hypothetical protein IJA86_08640 [Clostridia bacterium]|nr:hypothetical protein [Clostridia bacterium]
MCFTTFKRRVEAEFSAIPCIPPLITAGICLVLAVLVCVTGKNSYYQLFYDFPKGTPPLLLRAFLEGLFYAILGFSLGVFLFSKRLCKEDCYRQTALLFVCAVFVSYAHTIAVYRAGALFFGFLLSLLLFICLLTLFFTLKDRCFLSAVGIFLCFFRSFYIIYQTLAIFLLNA